MNGFIVVPDAFYDAIHKRLNELFVEFPDAAVDREFLYQQAVNYYAEYGRMPSFTLEKLQ